MSERTSQESNVRMPLGTAPERNYHGWKLHWTPIPVGTESDDEAAWSHNFTGQEVAVKRNGEGVCIEARDQDLVYKIEEKDDLKIALAFVAGFMEGHPEGEIL